MTSAVIHLIGWQRYWWIASRYDRLRNWLQPIREARANKQRVQELEHKLTGIMLRYGGSLDIDGEFEDICDSIDTHIEQQCVDAIRDHISSHAPKDRVH